MVIWDLYSKDRIPLGKTAVRGEKLTEGYHMTVHIAIFTEDGQKMLIQRRALDKDTFPGMWDISAAGSALAGETSAVAAHRELAEELGVNIDFEPIRPHFTLNYGNGFGDYYLVKRNIDLNTLVPQPEEVMDARYADCGEILKLIREGSFINYHESFIELLFDIKDRYGSFSNHVTPR